MYLLAQLFTGSKNKGFCILLFWHLKHPLKNYKYETICQLSSQIWVLTVALNCDTAWLGKPVLNTSKRLQLSKTMGTTTITQKDGKLEVNYSISLFSSKHKILICWVCYTYSSVLQRFRLGSGAGSEFGNKLRPQAINHWPIPQVAHCTIFYLSYTN
jgi:hypothetical protein